MYSYPVSPFCHQKREADDSTSLFVFQFLSIARPENNAKKAVLQSANCKEQI